MSGVFLLLLASVAATDPVSFPGPAEAPDPTNRYAVVCEAPAPGAAGGGAYALNLRAGPSGQTRNLLSFRRIATVLWAPGGNALAITVRDSSDASNVRVFFPDSPNESVDMGAELTKSFGRMPEREDNRHVYIEADRWLNPKTLRFRMRGYGGRDRQGFDELFDYALGGRVERAKSIVAALAADAIATRTPIPSPTQAAVSSREFAKAEYAVRWDPAKGGPKDAREVLSFLGAKEKEGDSFEIEYFDLLPPPGAPADAVTILRRRRSASGKGEIRLKYRRDRPLEQPWSCPAGSAFAQSEEEDFSFSGTGPPARVYSYSCSLEALEPPASLSAVPKPCSSRMVRYEFRGLKVEEWALPGGEKQVEVSRSARNTADEIASFEEIVARLLERGVHPSDGSKTEIASRCPVTATPTLAPLTTPTPMPSPASHDGNPFWVAGVDDPAAVRDFLSALKSAVAADDAGAIAALTSFPLEVSIDGRRQRVASSARFVQLYGAIFTPCLKRVVAAATAGELFANANGVMFGSGAIWFSPVPGGSIRIITINGPMAREKLCEGHP